MGDLGVVLKSELSLQYLIKKISSTYEMTFLYGMIISFLYDQSKHFLYPVIAKNVLNN